MDEIGVIRRVDQLGRIVIPMELRKMLKITEGTRLELKGNGNEIRLKKVDYLKNVLYYAQNCVKSLPEDKKIIICDDEKVICASKNMKSYINKAITSYLIQNSYRVFERPLKECIEGTTDEVKVSIHSIVTNGDRHGFVLEVDNNNCSLGGYIATLIATNLE